jgi:uncharacterized SAM-binding protein YcdF (DUF218 family)
MQEHVTSLSRITNMNHSKKNLSKLFKLLKISILLGCVWYFGLLLYIGTQVYKDNAVKSDAVLVLGARVIKNGAPNPCLTARIDHGVTLHKNKTAGKMIFTGGNDVEDGLNEAEEMKKMAIVQKVPSYNILLEKKSTSTYENFLYTKEIMEKNKIKNVIIVTEPFHSPRASLIAKKLKINHTVSPAKNSTCWTRWKFLSRYFLREPLVITLYMLQGKI